MFDVATKYASCEFCIRQLQGVTLLNDLGFGAPVPRTTAGRTVGVIFAAIGIPAHFILVLNIGLMVAVRLRRLAIARRGVRFEHAESTYSVPMPRWVKILPFACSGKPSTAMHNTEELAIRSRLP